MGKSAIARLEHSLLASRSASAVLLVAAAFPAGLHAATSAAGSGAEVVAPIAVTQADTRLRNQSAVGGRLTARAGETLTYTVIVRDLSEDNAVSVTLAYD